MKSFEEWQAKRVFLSEFDINFNGSSPAMEMEGAQTLWKRSLDLHNVRYRWMVSEGDSKAHSSDEIKIER